MAEFIDATPMRLGRYHLDPIYFYNWRSLPSLLVLWQHPWSWDDSYIVQSDGTWGLHMADLVDAMCSDLAWHFAGGLLQAELYGQNDLLLSRDFDYHNKKECHHHGHGYMEK